MEYDYLKIAGKPAIVTGGGRGIGRATALALGRFGAKVMICDVHDDWGESAVKEIRDHGGVAEYRHCDVADPEQVKALVAATVEVFGDVDILVNNAGIGSVSLPFEEITDEDWDRMLRVDLTAPFYLCREVIPYMKARKHGRSSTSAPAPGSSAVSSAPTTRRPRRAHRVHPVHRQGAGWGPH